MNCKNCSKRASFGEDYKSKQEYCKTHAPSNYVDVVHSHCVVCNKRAGFGWLDKSGERYCFKHAPSGALEVGHRKCEYTDCNIRPTYGKIGTKNPSSVSSIFQPRTRMNTLTSYRENVNTRTVRL